MDLVAHPLDVEEELLRGGLGDQVGEPRYASLKGIMAARKKQAETALKNAGGGQHSNGSAKRREARGDRAELLAADGLFQTFLSVLEDFGAYPVVVQRELDRYLPVL